jgi:hypothetical protein
MKLIARAWEKHQDQETICIEHSTMPFVSRGVATWTSLIQALNCPGIQPQFRLIQKIVVALKRAMSLASFLLVLLRLN